MKAISEKQSQILGVKTYVLEDGRVVVTATQLQEAFGQNRRGNSPTENQRAKLPRFLATKSLNSFISADLASGLNSPVEFMLLQGGAVALGYDSDVLTGIALAIVGAGLSAALRSDQQPMLDAAHHYLEATSRLGGRFALLDEHGMQPGSGAADDLRSDLQRLRLEVQKEREARQQAQIESREKDVILAKYAEDVAALSARVTLLQDRAADMLAAYFAGGSAGMSVQIAQLEARMTHRIDSTMIVAREASDRAQLAERVALGLSKALQHGPGDGRLGDARAAQVRALMNHLAEATATNYQQVNVNLRGALGLEQKIDWKRVKVKFLPDALTWLEKRLQDAKRQRTVGRQGILL